MVPLYSQVKDDILLRIREQEFGPSEKIPLEKEFAAMYKVSIITVRRAISELVEENILQRKQVKGTFVSQKPFQRSFLPEAKSFTENCKKWSILNGSASRTNARL